MIILIVPEAPSWYDRYEFMVTKEPILFVELSEPPSTTSFINEYNCEKIPIILNLQPEPNQQISNLKTNRIYFSILDKKLLNQKISTEEPRIVRLRSSMHPP